MALETVAVLGLGRVGTLVAKLLTQHGFRVTGYDAGPPVDPVPFAVRRVDLSEDAGIQDAAAHDALVSCLPYHLNARLAAAAHAGGKHYFDLTEDRATAETILELSRTARGVMAPQCGLAPGYVSIVGADLVQQFETCRALRLRVGALPQHPTGLMGYAFNWSAEGVVNEYLNDCEVIEYGTRKTVSPMEWVETVYVEGVQLEAFTTSGGLGTLCDTYHGQVENLDYKTMRYPGHVQMMNFFFHELLMRERRQLAGEILTHAKPPVSDDVVYMHISAEGMCEHRLQRKEFVRAYYPREVAGSAQTAIAWTTAASLVAVVELVHTEQVPQRGFLKQETVSLEQFFHTATGALLAHDAGA